MSSCFSQIFRFDSPSFIKLLSSKIEKNVSRNYGAILPVPIQNVSINAAASFTIQSFVRATTKWFSKYKP